jgi:hypothetical protein
MYLAPIERHLPKSPLSKRDHAVRAELTHVSTRLLTLEREQDVQFKRIAQIQQELEHIKRLLEKLARDA